ncbi:MAG TPA: sugar phosphate isomerase/epimerase, partial [Chloroflexota bacterium]|nr:sugar phosphate isomerase/epimerase [Chloroflexota bacterium]
MKLGVITGMTAEPEAALARVGELGLPTCQISVWHELATPELARRLRVAADGAGIEITTVWAGWPGPKVWNFVEGPTTIGIVPPAWRAQRVDALKRGADFAAEAGVPSIST